MTLTLQHHLTRGGIRMSRIDQISTIALATHSDLRGSLTVVQSGKDIPFKLERLFYIRETPPNCFRGEHAHRNTEQVFVAIAGAFSLEVTDGTSTKTFHLDDPSRGVYVPALLWARMRDFSEKTICLVLANTPYDASDYIRDWNTYVSLMEKGP